MTEKNYEEARARVHQLRSFYMSLITYLIVNVLLIVVNVLTSPDNLWFYWVTIFWGVGILFHAMTIFVGKGKLLGSEWEERKINKLMGKDDDGFNKPS